MAQPVHIARDRQTTQPLSFPELFDSLDRHGSSDIPFLAGNIRDTDFDDAVFPSTRMFEKGGVAVAVIGQAFPYTPIANPRWMMPAWSFWIREEDLRKAVASAERSMNNQDAMMSDARPGVQSLTRQTIPEVGQLVRDLRDTSEALRKITTSIEQQGATSVISSPKLPDYKP